MQHKAIGHILMIGSVILPHHSIAAAVFFIFCKTKRGGEFGEDLLLKPFLVALILTTMSSLVLCCRPSIGR